MIGRNHLPARTAVVVTVMLILQAVAGPAQADVRVDRSIRSDTQVAAGHRMADPDSYVIGRSSYQSVCQAEGSETPADSTLLSVNRWGDVADTFHDRLDADFWSDVFEKLQRRQLFSTMIQAGNSMWQLSSGLTGFATHFCLIDVVGADADAMTATLGNAITSSGLLAALLITALLVVLWRVSKGAGTWKAMIRPLGVTCLLVVLTTGAMSSTASSPGVGSPWWWASKTEKVVSNLAAAPMQALAVDPSATAGLTGDATDHGRTDCANYLRNMRDQYQAAFGSGMDTLSAEVPLTMSQMWENTGMSVWTKSQFGKDNPYGVKVGCLVLDNRTNRNIGLPTDTPATDGATGGTRLGMLDGGIPSANPASAAFNYAADDLLEDAAVIGLAACVFDGTSWSVEPGWSQIQAGGQSGGGGSAPADAIGAVSPEDCQRFWTEQSRRSVDDLSAWHLVYQDDPSYIDSAAKYFAAPAAGNFLANWHGNDNGSAFVLALTYDISSLIMLVVFGGISVGIIIAKTMLVVMLALVLIAVIASIWPGSGTSRIAQYLKLYLGITLFVFAVGTMFSLINLVTAYLGKASTALFSSGSLLSVLWYGFAPVTAVVILHMLFKHALRMPSPFKVSGALAWGGAIAGAGGAAALGLDRLASRGIRPFRSLARNGAFLGAPRMRRPGNSQGRVGDRQQMRAKDAISPAPRTNSAGTVTTAATAAGTQGVLPDADNPTGHPGAPLDAPSAKTSAAFAKRLATSGALLGEGASSKWLRRGVSALDRRLLGTPMSRRFRQIALGTAANGTEWLQRGVDATSRRARYKASSAAGSLKNTAVLTGARAKKAVEWSRAHPMKTAGWIAGGAVAAANLPLLAAGDMAVGAAGVAFQHPFLAGGVAAYALRRHRRTVTSRDPQAVAERRHHRQELYLQQANRVLRSGRLSPAQTARWTKRIHPGGPGPTPPADDPPNNDVGDDPPGNGDA